MDVCSYARFLRPGHRVTGNRSQALRGRRVENLVGYDYAHATPDQGQRVTLERGDASGRKLRAVGSIDVQPTRPNGPTHVFSLLGLPSTIFTPNGLVVLAFYRSDNGSPSRLLAAVLRG